MVANRNNLVIGTVERGTHEVVHSGVHHDEVLLAVSLHVEHAGQQDARVAHQGAARLEDQPVLGGAQAFFEPAPQRVEVEGSLIRVPDSISAAQVEVFDAHALGLKLRRHTQDFIQSSKEGLYFEDL